MAWITPEVADQWAMNRWGRAYRIDLSWSPAPSVASVPATDPELGRAKSPPPAPGVGHGSSPPCLDREPIQEVKNQEPASGRPAGVSLEDVQSEDLRDAGRLLELHRQAVARGLAVASEAGELAFAAAAEHARAVGTSNPPGLFAALVRRGAWSYATQAEEDAARRRLREYRRGPGPSAADRGPIAARPQAVVSSPRVSSFVPDARPGGPSRLAAILDRIRPPVPSPTPARAAPGSPGVP